MDILMISPKKEKLIFGLKKNVLTVVSPVIDMIIIFGL